MFSLLADLFTSQQLLKEFPALYGTCSQTRSCFPALYGTCSDTIMLPSIVWNMFTDTIMLPSFCQNCKLITAPPQDANLRQMNPLQNFQSYLFNKHVGLRVADGGTASTNGG
jgi:hypothetical protein